MASSGRLAVSLTLPRPLLALAHPLPPLQSLPRSRPPGVLREACRAGSAFPASSRRSLRPGPVQRGPEPETSPDPERLPAGAARLLCVSSWPRLGCVDNGVGPEGVGWAEGGVHIPGLPEPGGNFCASGARGRPTYVGSLPHFSHAACFGSSLDLKEKMTKEAVTLRLPVAPDIVNSETVRGAPNWKRDSFLLHDSDRIAKNQKRKPRGFSKG